MWNGADCLVSGAVGAPAETPAPAEEPTGEEQFVTPVKSSSPACVLLDAPANTPVTPADSAQGVDLEEPSFKRRCSQPLADRANGNSQCNMA